MKVCGVWPRRQKILGTALVGLSTAPSGEWFCEQCKGVAMGKSPYPTEFIQESLT